MKISRERVMLFGGTPDAYTALQRDGDNEIQAMTPASASCVLQRLLDRLAVRVDLEKLADAIIPIEIIAGLPNHVRRRPCRPSPSALHGLCMLAAGRA